MELADLIALALLLLLLYKPLVKLSKYFVEKMFDAWDSLEDKKLEERISENTSEKDSKEVKPEEKEKKRNAKR